MKSSILITNSGRDDHLMNVCRGLERQTVGTDSFEVVVGLINQETITGDLAMFSFPITVVHINQSGKFNYSQARNKTIDAARYDCIHLLDVDCIPAHDYVERMQGALENNPNAVYTASVGYLDKHKPYGSDLRAHIERMREVGDGGSLSYDLVWTLSLSLTRQMFDRVGGFDEQFEGYSSEDTDFGMRMQEVGVDYLGVDTRVYHQRHGAYGTPVKHIEDIIANATYFKSKWGVYSCLAWLEEFETSGYISLSDDGITLIKLPDEVNEGDQISSLQTYTIGVLSTRTSALKQPFLGGLESFTYHFIEALQAIPEYKVIVYAHQDSELPMLDTPYHPYPNLLKQSGEDVTQDKVFRKGEKIDISLALHQLDKQCDLIVNHSMCDIPILLQEYIQTPIITTFHHIPTHGAYRLSVLDLKLRGVLDVIDPIPTFITISTFAHRLWLKYVPEHMLQLIPNAITMSKWEFYSEPDQENPYMIWVSRICEEKGVNEAIRIAKKTGFTLKIVGAIYDKKYFTNEVEPHLNDQIEYLGERTQSELNVLIGNAQAFWFTPQREEPFGLVQIEALACGTPLIAYTSGAASDIITPEVGRLIKRGDHEGFIKALNDIPLLSRQRCRQRVQDHFSRVSMMKEYKQCIDSKLTKLTKLK